MSNRSQSYFLILFAEIFLWKAFWWTSLQYGHLSGMPQDWSWTFRSRRPNHCWWEGNYSSGGQKVRLSLARALYADYDILLLDDPISAVDSKVARMIHQRYLKKLSKDKTLILVTHQISYIQRQLFFILGINHYLSGIIFYVLLVKYYLLQIALINCNKNIHENMVNRIVRSPASFFDRIPAGVLTYKFSSDLGILDNSLAFALI